jgi:hypothetical protein
MSSRSDRRRRREEALAAASAPATPAPAAAEGPRPPAAPPAPHKGQRRRGLPALPLLGAGAGLALLGAAYLTTLPPGPGAGAGPSGFTVRIPPERLAVINSWERFFICYDLAEGVQLPGGIVDLTLRAHQRATGGLDFPGERVEIVLPATRAEPDPPPAGAGEEEIINLRQSIAQAAADGAVARQCGGAG